MHSISANGAKIPAIGLGTWTFDDDAADTMVAAALNAGYRHIDTAAMYKNEVGVGAGLKATSVARNDIFVTTKVWFDQISEGALQASVERSLAKLGLDHVDLILIHWPSKTTPLSESIGALNDVVSKGLTRHIGVSNFTVQMVKEAAQLSTAPIACNQIENHPLLNQGQVIGACRSLGIGVTSYCPLARGGDLFAHPAITGPAQRLEASPAQIVLRWHVQQDGIAAIPRTTKPARLAENLDVFRFHLEQSEMDAITALTSAGQRICDFEFSPVWDAA